MVSTASPPTINGRTAVVVVNYRTAPLAVRCVRSLLAERHAIADLRVLVVDGGSGDGSAEHLKRELSGPEFHDWVALLPLPINGGFGWANNQGIMTLMRGVNPPELIHLLNPDTEIEPGAVQVLRDFLLQNPDVGAVGSQLLEPDGSATGSAFSFPTLRGEFARATRTGLFNRLLQVRSPTIAPSSQEVQADWVTGASVMLRVAALRQIGLFDDGFFLYHEEVELMWRMRKAGWAIWHQPESRVKHVGGAATGVHSRDVEEAQLPRRPAYWYESRIRYFARTRGFAAARAAWLMWLAGHLVFRARRAAGLAGSAKLVRQELGDAFQHGHPLREHGVMGRPASLDGPVGTPPAWMRP